MGDTGNADKNSNQCESTCLENVRPHGKISFTKHKETVMDDCFISWKLICSHDFIDGVANWELFCQSFSWLTRHEECSEIGRLERCTFGVDTFDIRQAPSVL